VRHAEKRSELETRRRNLEQDCTDINEEKERLAAGHDAVPLLPSTRHENVRDDRVGAPLWRLVDFQAHLTAEHRAGLEASLEACGLLDAWVAPDGTLTNANGAPIWDNQWFLRPGVQGDSLLNQLLPAVPEDSVVPPQLVEALLAGVSCGAVDECISESCVAVDGRYRLGALTGAWNKQEAVYIGHTARAQARERRIQEVTQLLQALDIQVAVLMQDFALLAAEHRIAQRSIR
jgi:hypothetical protein